MVGGTFGYRHITPESIPGHATIAKGTKSEVATSPLPFRGPKSGWNCYIIPAFLGGPQQREQNQKWLNNPYLGKVES